MWKKEDVALVEKYRPRTIDETILPERLKKVFKSFVESKEIPHLLLAGSHGVGKTTVAKAMLDEMGAQTLVINGSLHGNIDKLRTDITNFASTVSFTSNGGRKFIILDEADGLTPATQPALRNFMEAYSKNAGFILTANFPSKIIEPLRSRCAVIDFKIPSAERKAMAVQFMKRLIQICEAENIEYEQAALGGLITRFFPDLRRTLNELQAAAKTGKIDSGVLAVYNDESLNTLLDFMKKKQFSNAQKWVIENQGLEPVELFHNIYQKIGDSIELASKPTAVHIIAEYSYRSHLMSDQVVNTAACIGDLMMECTWKS